MNALAYLNWGTWVVDCPAPGCHDARLVYHPKTGARQREDVCANGHRFAIVMPPPELEAQIVTAVGQRPHDADRAWYPKGHARAAAAGFPTGQSVTDLTTENTEVHRYRAARAQAKQQQLLDALTAAGIEIDEHGNFAGKVP